MKRLLSYLLVICAMASCGVAVRRQGADAGRMASAGASGNGKIAGLPAGFPQEVDIPDSLQAFYDYTEGLKAALIYDDKVLARRWFEKSAAKDSLFAPAYYQIAGLLIEQSPAEALPFSRRARELDSLNVDYGGLLARALVTSGHHEEALPLYNKLLKEDPLNPVNYRMLALLYEIGGQPYTAIAVLDTAEYKLGLMEELGAMKRQLLINAGMFDRALEESDALINDYPYNDMNYLIRGNIYRSMGQDSAALANYTEALRIDSTNITTLMSLADFYRRKSDNNSYLMMVNRIFLSDDFPRENKIEVFDDITSDVRFYRNNYFMINALAGTLLLKYPGDFPILALYGTHLLRSGEIEKALGMYKDFSASHPAQREPYYAIIDIESYLQRPDSVAKYSDTALTQFPADSELYMRKGFALSNMKKNNEAVKAYRRAFGYAQSDSTRSVAAGVLGDHYHQTGDIKKTYASYRRALRYNPDNELVLNNYAYYLSEEDRELELALEMSRRANELNPGNPTSLDTYAWILYKLGRYEEARGYMLQAVSLDTTQSEVLYLHYGDILYKLGEEFMARIYWRKAREQGYDEQEIEERYKLLEE